MMKAAEVKEWIKDIPDDADLAIDEGGLILIVVAPGQSLDYIEIGGEPLEDDDDEVSIVKEQANANSWFTDFCNGFRRGFYGIH